MKFTEFSEDTNVRPFRFAVILAAILITAMLTQSARSQEVNWSTSYREAIETAEQNNTPVLLLFSGSDWCPWCEKLNNEVLNTAESSAWLDSRMVPVLLDFPKTTQQPAQLTKQNSKLLERYRPHLTGFPTALFIKPDGTVIGKLGYEKGGVRKWIQKAQPIVGKLDKAT